MLIERNVSPFVIRLLLFMYSNQSMRVKWEYSLSDNFSIGNGARMDKLFVRLHDLGVEYHVVPILAGSFGYADDIALLTPTLYAMD